MLVGMIGKIVQFNNEESRSDKILLHILQDISSFAFPHLPKYLTVS